MIRIPRLTLVPALLLISVSMAQSQPIDADANINLYLTPANYAGCNTIDDGELATCSNLSSPPVPAETFLWVITSHQGGLPRGIGGIQFGVEHQGLDVLAWTLCTGGSEIPQTDPLQWPESGTGIAITWSAGCYMPSGEVAKIGYFTLLAGDSGAMQIIGDPRLAPRQALWVDCDLTLIEYCEGNLGAAALAAGTSPTCGDNCQGSTPTLETTWSAIKAHFD